MNKSKAKFKENEAPFLEKVSNKLQVFGFKLGSNKVLCSMRDGFGVAGVPMMGMILPVIIATLFFNNGTMLGNIEGIKDSAGMIWLTKYIYPFLMSTQQAATVGFSLLFLVCTAFFMSKNYVTKGSPLTATILTVACFFALAPFGMSWDGALTLSWNTQPFSEIKVTNLGTNGLIPAIFVALTVPYFFGKLTANEKLRIKLPDTIPPAIADVLTNVISITIMLLSYALLAWTWALIAMGCNIKVDSADGSTQYIADNIFTVITSVVGKPLQVAATSPWFTGFLTLLMTTFWIFGIHGTNLITPIQVVVIMPSVIANIYFWQFFTNPTIQSIIVGHPGTGIGDAYYNVKDYLIANNPLLKPVYESDAFKAMASGILQGGDATQLITQFMTDESNASLVQNIMQYNSSDYVTTITQLVTTLGCQAQDMLDPAKGFFFNGAYHNSIVLIPLNGLDSVGGTGMTFGLTYSILLFSKFKPYREVAKLESVPAIFGINEPIVFGLPIVLNFVIAIPFITGAVTLSIICHYLVIWHIVRPLVAMPISFIPMILLPYLMSGFDWRAIIVAIITSALSIGYYAAFLKASEKFSIKTTAKQMGMTTEEYLEANKTNLFVDKIYKKPAKKQKIEK